MEDSASPATTTAHERPRASGANAASRSADGSPTACAAICATAPSASNAAARTDKRATGSQRVRLWASAAQKANASVYSAPYATSDHDSPEDDAGYT